jgi:hypothetical protein
MGVKLVSSSAGSVEIVAPATASNFTATMPAGTGTVAVQGASTNIVSATVQASTSGTAINFTDIPSWVRRVTVVCSALSTNGSSNPIVQLGTSGGVQATSYTGSVWLANTSNNLNSTGFFISPSVGTATVLESVITLVLLNSATGLWVASIVSSQSNSATSIVGSGSKTLSGTLDRVRITMVNGTDTFDAGSINILYE